ncbi:hypothetical protein TURU_123175 [Turdus rufiventris]|nr:hypothetical protein TURU_123175 [Turdus rufiventris]
MSWRAKGWSEKPTQLSTTPFGLCANKKENGNRLRTIMPLMKSTRWTVIGVDLPDNSRDVTVNHTGLDRRQSRKDATLEVPGLGDHCADCSSTEIGNR